ncbi:kallikrein-14-like [Paramacrobiotus metropolitanus]|uniref:kallikrein-14-like n=1 Tax=Paramacrobiotus metropolitanus TaxID=2943436 RepID=UPI002445F98A|nr:kallikrein-14-like [Paramacrobiotus metropolitanus]
MQLFVTFMIVSFSLANIYHVGAAMADIGVANFLHKIDAAAFVATSRAHRGSCGGSISINDGESITIRSPNYPNKYGNNLVCKWIISSATGKSMTVSSNSFHLEYSSICQWDYWMINGIKYCGTVGPQGVTFSGQKEIWFITDSTITDLGFDITIKVPATVPPTCTDSSNCPFKCGIPQTAPNLTPSSSAGRIVGGVTAVAHSWPWQVGILTAAGNNFQFCGGSVLDTKWILTAAHCCIHQTANDLRVRVGAHNLSRPDASTQIIPVSRIVMHPSYGDTTQTHDFCMLQLREAISISRDVLPVCLPTALDASPGTRCFTTGWGVTQASRIAAVPNIKALLQLQQQAAIGKIPPRIVKKLARSTATVLQQVDVAVMEANACAAKYSPISLIDDSMLCATAPGKDSCQGDSGGPLVCPRADGKPGFVLAGVTSWGIGCARPNYPGVYGKVIGVVPWITTTMAS